MKKKTKIEIIAAIGEKMEIGYQNQLLCHLPADLKYFKSLTTGHTVVMGRKTWDSLPIKPLPQRRNIILTSNPALIVNNAEVVLSLKELFSIVSEEETLFIIGGETLYQIFLPFADVLHLTRIHQSFVADAFFPEFDKDKWILKRDLFYPKDEKNPFNMTFQTYISI